ncbi:dTDP-4-dehydrorhamnose reductase [Achromobacter sp. NFACC18-2]|uniref:dTDP-4-dehydrorhamnose reductase n=1 Tax=Achromobacter sp. NFACC18-2 TaxID=1564112 RepID=UPI0008D0A2D6|nr:dTDP-4-dehydrorhamnose reductase [Achromobacter sp. NFACC18-2]SEJ41506.1 dTDP-4-dehydrorhamnose reductase [Achromobacter sp. NFACC18-2]
MKILLLGKTGQVGIELQRTLLPLGELIALGRAEADLARPTTLLEVLEAHSPDVIVNAAAYTAVDKAEANSEMAHAINAESVSVIAQYARARDALLVHYSTDYVFDGAKASPYEPADTTNPLSVYGRTKREGEEAIVASGCRFLLLRTSWVFSAHGSNFLKTILRLAKERDELNIVDDQYGAPTSAELIADVTALAITGHRQGLCNTGIYHLTAAGQTTWHGFACHIVARAAANGARIRATPELIRPIPTEAYPLPARRPKNSRLGTSALSDALLLQFPDWTVHANRTVDQMTTSMEYPL